ncbi:hypothetical protein [Thermococcus sp.]|nr:hypothetical protein [Thermococcus sp.]
MAVIDTNVAIERVREREEITENITGVTTQQSLNRKANYFKA